MSISITWFELLINVALGIAVLAPIVLITLVIIDLKKEQLW